MLTGESGSGKTEAGKLVLQYIAAVTGHAQVLHGDNNYHEDYNDKNYHFYYYEDDVDYNDCLPGVSRHQIPAVAIQPGARRFDFFLNNNKMMMDVITIQYVIKYVMLLILVKDNCSAPISIRCCR